MKISDIPSYCLVLDKRYTLWIENYQPRLQAVGIDPYMFLSGGMNIESLTYDRRNVNELPPYYGRHSIQYPTWFARPNAYNAWLSHKKIMEMALSVRHERILMLEDDAFPESDFQEIYSQCEDFIDNEDWDMLYLGCFTKNNLTDIGHKYIKRMNGGAGFHGVIISKKIMEILINFLPIGPFDWICERHIMHQFKCFAITPCILSQSDGYSYVEASVLKKPDRNMT